MDHPTDRRLTEYIFNKLILESELAPVEEHLLICHLCQDRVLLLEAFHGRPSTDGSGSDEREG